MFGDKFVTEIVRELFKFEPVNCDFGIFLISFMDYNAYSYMYNRYNYEHIFLVLESFHTVRIAES